MYEEIVTEYFEIMQDFLAQPNHSFKEERASIPAVSGVYIITDNSKSKIIYAGRTKNLRRRLMGDHKRGTVEGSQFRKALGKKLSAKSEEEISNYIRKNCTFQFLVIPSFQETVRIEHFTTSILAPTLNVQLKQ